MIIVVHVKHALCTPGKACPDEAMPQRPFFHMDWRL